MLGENTKAGKKSRTEDISGGSYLLFLILILLIMGNQNAFDNYFALLGNQVNGINSAFSTFVKTADGLKTLLKNDKKDTKTDLF